MRNHAGSSGGAKGASSVTGGDRGSVRDVEKLATEYSRSLAIDQGYAEGDRVGFAGWMSGHTLPEKWIKSLDVPDREPDAVSLDGDRKEVYRWYQAGGSVFGFHMP